jgi:tRNA-specific 2-thiouridylase
MYIKEIRADRNEIVLSGYEETYCKAILCSDLNFMSIPEPETGEALRCQAKVRYRHSGQYALLEKIDEERVRISFDEPVRFAAPGQSAVFYDSFGRIICGGIIG